MSVASSEVSSEGAESGRWVRSTPPSATGSRQQTAQPSLGLRGKRASEPVPPSKPERRRVAVEFVRLHHEHKKDAECDRRHREEMHGDEFPSVILKNCSPCLRGAARARPSGDTFGRSRRRPIETYLKK
jgi:hypothetical protein